MPLEIGLGAFTCKFEGKVYEELDLFDSGINGCAKCICVETHVYCNTTRCPSLKTSTQPSTIIPTFATNLSTESNSEVDDMNVNDPNQDVEDVNAISSEEITYRPYQFGSGSIYRNRAHVYIHHLGRGVDTEKQIQCHNGLC